MEQDVERKLRTLLLGKIRFTAGTVVSGIDHFDPAKKEHQDAVIDRIVHLAEEVYGGGGPSLKSHRHLSDSWTIVYTTTTGDKARKNYISPIEVLSPFGSSAIAEVEIVHAGSD